MPVSLQMGSQVQLHMGRAGMQMPSVDAALRIVITGSVTVLVHNYWKRKSQHIVGIGTNFSSTCLLYTYQMQAVCSAHKEFLSALLLK